MMTPSLVSSNELLKGTHRQGLFDDEDALRQVGWHIPVVDIYDNYDNGNARHPLLTEPSYRNESYDSVSRLPLDRILNAFNTT